jgi:hypothetical protein
LNEPQDAHLRPRSMLAAQLKTPETRATMRLSS